MFNASILKKTFKMHLLFKVTEEYFEGNRANQRLQIEN